MCSMSISSIGRYGSAAIDKIVSKIPSVAISNQKVLNGIKWTANHLAAPHNNRLILGATAIILQPIIDLCNRKVDEDTREISAKRTAAKIIAGTSTGYAIRYACLKLIDYLTKDSKSLLYPKGVNVVAEGLKNYRSAIGTFAGLFVMLFTNFLIDAPLTKYLTNKFIKNNDKGNKGTEMPNYFPRPQINNFASSKVNKEVA